MIRHELAVEQGHTGLAQRDNQPCQRDLRGIRRAAEHAFAAEHPIETDAVKAADKHAILPAFDCMRMSGAMERMIAVRDALADPAVGMFGPGCGAGFKDRIEGRVAGYGEAPAFQNLSQRVRTVEPVQRQDGAPFGFDPEYFGIIA
nr:hypothetical protein [Caenibius tardaugens]